MARERGVSLKRLKDIVEYMKGQDVLCFKIDGIEVQFAPNLPSYLSGLDRLQETEDDEPMLQGNDLDSVSEDDLYHSAS